jgi:Fur family ferric uptake transcriptional regulator
MVEPARVPPSCVSKFQDMKIAETAIIQLLKRHNINVTRNRIKVLAMICSMDGIICASRVVEETGVHADRVTIYRTLQVFYRKGLLQLVPNTHGKVEFCMNAELSGRPEKDTLCARSVCTICGSQVRVSFPEPAIITGMFGFDPREILIRGLCWSCKSGHKAQAI